MAKIQTIIDVMLTVFSDWFRKPWLKKWTWGAWTVVLKVLTGKPLDEDEALIYKKHTKRETAPRGPVREFWGVMGRRAGKTLMMAFYAVWLACFRDYKQYLQPGEVGTVGIIAADRKQSRVLLRYTKGFLSVPILRKLVVNETAESIELSNGIVIEIHTASFRSTRGYTMVAVICDEIAFWRSDESANPDKEILAALRPALSTIPNSVLICISSPYARRGAMWEAYERHFGKDDSPVLVWQATSQEMNPTLPDSVIQQALAEDESAARAEYYGEFRKDIEAFVSREAVDAAVAKGRIELRPIPNVRYVGFVDPSGGSNDSFTLGIAHSEQNGKILLDVVREIKPPFSPESVVEELCGVLKMYGLTQVTGDAYAGEFSREPFRKQGLNYVVSDKNRSELYLALLPLLNSGRIELLDNQRLVTQLLGLERRTARSGRDSIDHAPHSHDDLINAAAGALVLAQVPISSLVKDGTFVGKPRHPEFRLSTFPFRRDF